MDRKSLQAVIPLSPDRFTALTQTPWAGRALAATYKREVVTDPRQPIGESWEFSCDHEFPSLVMGSRETLAMLVDQFPEEILSPFYAGGKTCEILVKLLNAAAPLSVQVHPEDNDPYLKANECGKPESWLVLAAEPGAGIYLGFSRSISRAKLRELLLDGERCKDYLNFVPVRVGDYFEIAPGVPHAIGPGVTLLEPQRIIFSKSGKTYRLWDWGRRYNSAGAVDQLHGKPRVLHLEEGLRLIDPEKQVGETFVKGLRRQAAMHQVAGMLVAEFPANPYYQLRVLDWQKKQSLQLSWSRGYGAVVVLEGALQARSAKAKAKGVTLRQGQPALLPFSAAPQQWTGISGTKVALVMPAGNDLVYSPAP